jgi:DNA-binding response OmpR family regulator
MKRLSTPLDGRTAQRDTFSCLAMSTVPNVLIADDSAVARLTIVRRLRARAFHVVEADSAATARAADATALTCALLDLDLGDGDGVEVAVALRAVAPNLPVAFFSAESEGSPLALRAAAMGSVFHKPDALDAAIKWILEINPT